MQETFLNPFRPEAKRAKKRLFQRESEVKVLAAKKEKISQKVEKSQIELLEKRLELKKQYDEQFETLKESGLIWKLESGQWGIVDILGKERPIPTYEQIRNRMAAKWELLDKKTKQGFIKLQLVPFGLPLAKFIDCAKKVILKKHKEGKLIATNGDKLELDEKQPIYVNDDYKNADVAGDLVYGVKRFDPVNHGGQTKAEIIEAKDDPFSGWMVSLQEDLADLPAKDQGKEIRGRKQIEYGQSPQEYLQLQQEEDQYAGESYTTPEEQLVYLIYNLLKRNQVIDDWSGQGKGCWNVGAYFKGAGLVPRGIWLRRRRQFILRGDIPDAHFASIAVRPSVII